MSFLRELIGNNDKFIGRQRELNNLTRLLQQPRSTMRVIKGRRRIGKSRLAS